MQLISKTTMCVLVTQLCLTLCDPMDCSLPGSSVHWILQARILEWVAISYSILTARTLSYSSLGPQCHIESVQWKFIKWVNGQKWNVRLGKDLNSDRGLKLRYLLELGRWWQGGASGFLDNICPISPRELFLGRRVGSLLPGSSDF